MATTQAVTVAIVLFVFVCILFPRIVKNRTQFYAAFGLVIVTLLLGVLAAMFQSEGFSRFAGVVGGFFTVAALVLVVLATGGLSLKDLTGEFRSAIEVIRRGESDKEIIVPITGEMPKPRRREASAGGAGGEEERVVHAIETPTTPAAPGATPRAGDSPGAGAIPLE